MKRQPCIVSVCGETFDGWGAVFAAGAVLSNECSYDGSRFYLPNGDSILDGIAEQAPACADEGDTVDLHWTNGSKWYVDTYVYENGKWYPINIFPPWKSYYEEE